MNLNKMWYELAHYFHEGWEDIFGSAQEVSLWSLYPEFILEEEILEQFVIDGQLFSISRYKPTVNHELFKEKFRQQNEIVVFQPFSGKSGKFALVIFPVEDLEVFLRMIKL